LFIRSFFNLSNIYTFLVVCGVGPREVIVII
jgi:hypothetical protein